MAVEIGRRIRHRDVLEAQRHRRRLVYLELIERDQRFVLEDARVHHHGRLRTGDIFLRRILEFHFDEWRPIVIEKLRALALDDLHQARDAENLVRLTRARAAGDDERARREALDAAQHGSERIGQRDCGAILVRSPRLVRLHRHDLAPHQRIEIDTIESLCDRALDVVVLRNDDAAHFRKSFGQSRSTSHISLGH